MEGNPNIEDKKVEGLLEGSDIAINPETGLALVVIKPDAYPKRAEILQRIKRSGLSVVKTASRRLPDKFVAGVMYKDLPQTIEEETLRHFNGGPSEIILLQGGPDLVRQIVSLTGEKTNPNECDEESIRYLFGDHVGRETEDGNTYHRNAIHRGKDPEEQKGDLEKFKDLLA